MKFIGFAAILFIVFGLFVVSKTVLASPSDNIVIMQVQTEGSTTGTSGEEFILLYNHSDADVDITDWCLQYSSASNGLTFTQIECVEPLDNSTKLWLESGGYVSFGSEQFNQANNDFIADFNFSPKMASTGGHIRLVNKTNDEIDRLGWGTAVSPEGLPAPAATKGEVLSRKFLSELIDSDINSIDFSSQPIIGSFESGLYEIEIIRDVCNNIDGIQADIPDGMLQDSPGGCYVDVCPNLDGLQIELPIDYTMVDSECQPKALEDSKLVITELLPNAPSYDTGQEFIEIFNPNSELVSLIGYKLQLGPYFSSQYDFEEGSIKPGEYLYFSDSLTGITLPNSSASVRLVSPAGNVVSETIEYSNPEDTNSWALIDDQWIYTNQITAGSSNKPFLQLEEQQVLSVTSLLSPCPEGKYRNPATNRCKSISTSVSQLKPCNSDQYRNPETNRCKNISSTTSNLKPCDVDEYRNPETNRCRKIASNTNQLKECAEGQERNPETNRCRKVAGVIDSQNGVSDIEEFEVKSSEGRLNLPVIFGLIMATVGYIAYEWRFELKHFFADLRFKQ